MYPKLIRLELFGHFGPKAGIRVNLILGCYSKGSVTVSCYPGERDSDLQLLVHFLVNGATKLCPVVHLSVNLESTRLVANCEVALGNSALQGLRIRRVPSQSALIAKGPSEVKVRISGQADMVPPAPCLVFSTPTPAQC